jgi:hypothetical protein
MRNFVDIGDAATWPDDVHAFCDSLAAAARHHDDGVDVLDEYDPDAQATLRGLLRDCWIVAYHGTRLLNHERDNIAANGLRVLTPAHADHRIEDAHHHGCITAVERDQLLAATVFRSRQPEPSRSGSLFLFTSRTELEDPGPNGLYHMLEEWGGEAVRMSAESRDLPPHLVSLGTPSIVVAAVNLTAPTRITNYLHYAFVRTLLGEERGITITCNTDVPAADIIDIWQPGHPEYDAYTELARA